jgi:hypothetical protein
MFVYNDGGRGDAGYEGNTGDCVTRAISIATRLSYKYVYDSLNTMSQDERIGKRKRKLSNARTGVYRQTYERFLNKQGWTFHPTMFIGSGCKVHLTADELPKGTIICRVSRHLCVVIDGVIHDTHDPSRGGTRCVYGYFAK